MLAIPLLPAFLGLILGIILSLPEINRPSSSIVMNGLMAIGVVGLLSVFKVRSYILWQASLFLLWIGIGFSIAHHDLQTILKNSFLSNNSKQKLTLIGDVQEDCIPRAYASSLIMRVTEVKNEEGQVFQLSEKIKLSIGGNGPCPFQKGDRVQTQARLKKADFYKNDFNWDASFFLAIQGITLTGFVENSDFVVKVGQQRSWFDQQLIQWKIKVRQSLAVVQSSEVRILLESLMLGHSTVFSKRVDEAFQKTGTSHLLVVSGFHLVMVAGVVYVFWRILFSFHPPLFLHWPVRQICAALTLPAVVIYSLLVSFNPSVFRACISAVVVGVLWVGRRSTHALALWVFTAFFVLLIEPLWLFDLSFQLSFFSVLFLLLASQKWRARLIEFWRPFQYVRLLRGTVTLLFSSCAVALGLLPLLIYRFHQVSLVQLPANLILVPCFTFFLMPLGVAGLILALFSTTAAAWCFQIAALGFEPVLKVFLEISTRDILAWVPGFNLPQIIAYYAVLGLVYWRSFRLKWLVLVGLILLNGVLWGSFFFSSSSNLKFRLLDVGQGDALLIELPDGKRLLVDGGGSWNHSFDLGKQVLLPHFLGHGMMRLDVMVLTHPHPDHFGGLTSLLSVLHPQEIWWNGEWVHDPAFQAFLAEAVRLQIPLKRLRQGPQFEYGQVRWRVLSPAQEVEQSMKPSGQELNNHSLVLEGEYQSFRFLLAGDIEKETEQLLVNQHLLKPAQLLKVPHHGSNTSSTMPFLCALRPQVALIGVGRENVFHFPRLQVLQNYQQFKTRLFRTDLDGQVDLSWDGQRLTTKTFSKPMQESIVLAPNPDNASPLAICE